jgi:hypothetical protein
MKVAIFGWANRADSNTQSSGKSDDVIDTPTPTFWLCAKRSRRSGDRLAGCGHVKIEKTVGRAAE